MHTGQLPPVKMWVGAEYGGCAEALDSIVLLQNPTAVCITPLGTWLAVARTDGFTGAIRDAALAIQRSYAATGSGNQ